MVLAGSSVPLPPERATFSEPGTTTSRLAQHSLAVPAHHNCLRVTEHSGYVEAPLALDIHKERVGGLHEPLELVLPLLKLSWWMEQIDIVLKHHLE